MTTEAHLVPKTNCAIKRKLDIKSVRESEGVGKSLHDAPGFFSALAGDDGRTERRPVLVQATDSRSPHRFARTVRAHLEREKCDEGEGGRGREKEREGEGGRRHGDGERKERRSRFRG